MKQRQEKPTGIPHDNFGVFIHQVVSAASIHPGNALIHSAVRCFKKTNRHRCQGRIMVKLGETNNIEWACPTCRVSGSIQNWQESWSDLSELQSDDTAPHFELVVPLPEFDCLAKHLSDDPEFEMVIYAAMCDDENAILQSSNGEIKALNQALNGIINNKKRLVDREIVWQLIQGLKNAEIKCSPN
jgi:hypothetical protein